MSGQSSSSSQCQAASWPLARPQYPMFHVAIRIDLLRSLRSEPNELTSLGFLNRALRRLAHNAAPIIEETLGKRRDLAPQTWSDSGDLRQSL